ncbi:MULTISPECIES: AraC family transcriptional regulator [unclassified Pseudoxanthomonas]|uniref:helix-turn-helix transcriptional regulator n=1 Tax=unclassified Pseudoxanthomonas TaxID=2645906 RepID=UPI0008EA5175|nr:MULTISPECIES: AraC family transcriptional regulator [unclassified Pseudoxanthomonas]PPJ41070.1 AraC family transcriptional regulator [Pseudoxanthomonas sp. KAs_5_3]SFV31333.1 transcriptional regulator, AraC family [Pseudoxanthomonas sp. YR558]
MASPLRPPAASQFDVVRLLDTATVSVRDVRCRGECRHRSNEECIGATHLVFPYRGTYLRHVGQTQAVADANHVLLFNAGEGYQVSHPVEGGDANFVLQLADALLDELAPAPLRRRGAEVAFRHQALRIDARTQALVALLGHALRRGACEPLEAEGLALTLTSRSLGTRTAHVPGATRGRQRLVDRAKLLLASDPGRRWTLAEIADEIGGSPVYLTQVFRQVEGLPLYRYQLQLRLARALDLLATAEDVSAVAHDLGFSSHSHFASAFRQAYGRSPSTFRAS